MTEQRSQKELEGMQLVLQVIELTCMILRDKGFQWRVN